MGWSGEDLEATIDLGQPRPVRRVGVDCLRAQGPWIFLPGWAEVSVSVDGEEWVRGDRTEVPLENQLEKEVVRIDVEIPPVPRPDWPRYVRVRARNQGPLPEWHPGAPENAWLFVDEIVVEGASEVTGLPDR